MSRHGVKKAARIGQVLLTGKRIRKLKHPALIIPDARLASGPQLGFRKTSAYKPLPTEPLTTTYLPSISWRRIEQEAFHGSTIQYSILLGIELTSLVTNVRRVQSTLS